MIVVELTEYFATTHAGRQEGVNVFGYAKLKSGEYVCSVQALDDFPMLFDKKNVQLHNVTIDDFEQPIIEEL